MLCEHKGSDPVTIKLKDYDDDIKILTSSMFWVETTNELTNSLNKAFGDRISVSVRSLDSNLAEEPALA